MEEWKWKLNLVYILIKIMSFPKLATFILFYFILFYFILLFNFILFYYFCLFRAAPEAYGGSQAKGWNPSYNCWPIPQPQQRQIRAESVTYATAHGNARSLTH